MMRFGNVTRRALIGLITLKNGVIYNNLINTTGSWVCQWGTQGIYIDAQNLSCQNISVYNNVIWGNGTGFEIGTEKGGTLSNIKLTITQEQSRRDLRNNWINSAQIK